MLASGVDHKDEWWIRKKNNAYLAPTNASELDFSWLLTDPSPWISAKKFNTFWSNKVVYTDEFTSDYIYSNRQQIFNKPFEKGDVIQVIQHDFLNSYAKHTMYITDYGYYNGNLNFMLTYHSNDIYKKNLIELCELYPNDSFKFFRMR